MPESHIELGPSLYREEEKSRKGTLMRGVFFRRFQEQIKPSIHPQHKIIQENEIKKPDYLLDAIRMSNAAFAPLLRETGQHYNAIHADHYHLLPQKIFQKVARREGEPPMTQGVAAKADQRYRRAFISSSEQPDHPIGLVQSVLHETGHLHEFNSVEFVPNSRDNFIFRRTGWKVFGTNADPHPAMFVGVEEAVMATLEQRLLAGVLDATPLLQNLRHKDPQKDKKRKTLVARREQVPIDEISWTDEKGSSFGVFPYLEQRAVLSYIVQCIYEDGEGLFESPEAVMDTLFIHPAFNGDIFSTARKVRASFGRNAFRTLGGMSERPAHAHLTFDDLRKQRLNRK